MLRNTLLSTLPLLALLGLVKADETVFSTTTYDVVARIPVTEYVWTNDAGSLTSTQITGTASYVPADETESATVTSSTEPPAVLETALALPSFLLSDIAVTSVELTLLSPTAVAAAPKESELVSNSVLSAAVTSAPSSSASAIPSGVYFSTGTSSTTTTLEDGSSAVVEYVVLYTNVCSASDY